MYFRLLYRVLCLQRRFSQASRCVARNTADFCEATNNGLSGCVLNFPPAQMLDYTVPGGM